MASKYKIVVIDDETGVTELMKRTFEDNDYEIRCENDSVKGLELIQKTNPDVVLLDIKMPAMDGMEILSHIKDFNSKINVIMITGYGSLESAMEAMKMGAYDYITKPFDLNFVKELVMRSLEEKIEK